MLKNLAACVLARETITCTVSNTITCGGHKLPWSNEF